MTDRDPLLIISLTAMGVLIGFVVRVRLSALAYRHDDEVGQPHPGPRWWIPLATAKASGLLAWRFGVERWPLLLPTLPLASFGHWLSAIDLDVADCRTDCSAPTRPSSLRECAPPRS